MCNPSNCSGTNAIGALFIILCCLIAGVGIYLVSNPTPLTSMLEGDLSPTWPNLFPREVGFYVPDFLWSVTAAIATGYAVKGLIGTSALIATCIVAGVSHESMQWLDLLPGTPCPIDTMTSLAGGLLAGLWVLHQQKG